MKNLPTYERVQELLDYTPETGVFRWKVARKRNQVKAGSVAGCPMLNGYLAIGIDGARIYSHRLAWFVLNGRWPTAGVDHLDGNRHNNSAANLREASQLENAQNTRRPANNTSGVTGVHWHSQLGKWIAYVGVGGRRRSAGCFDSIDEAVAARRAMKASLHAFHPEQVAR